MRHKKELIENIKTLRLQGKTYGEINAALKIKLAKSTLNSICKNTSLPSDYLSRISALNILNLGLARATALEINKIKREEFFKQINSTNSVIASKICDRDIAKIALSMLCLGEASKSKTRSSFCLGNSDPRIIILFIKLLKMCFENFDPKKIRCTVQCRADQDTNKLEDFWQKVSGIPKKQFYKSRIDVRTIGKPTKNKNYKGVFKVDYLNTKTQLDLESLADLIYNSVSQGP